MLSRVLYLLFFSIIIIEVVSLHYPGILISIPENLTLPKLKIPVPQNLQSINIEELQITNAVLQIFDFQWTYKSQKLEIYNTKILISFDWKYRKDNGKGTFNQDNVQIDIGISFKRDLNNNRLVVDMDSIKKKGGHMSIHLGGNVPQTIVVEITDLIINRGSFIFWRFIQKILKKEINKLIEPLTSKDIQLFCKQKQSSKQQLEIKLIQNEQFCQMLSTILVADPIIYNRHTILQINGFPYSYHDSHSQFLDPSSVLQYSNSSKFQIQIHQDLFNKLIQDVLKQQNFHFEFDSMGVSGITQINTLVLTNVFPQMDVFKDNPQNVIFDIFVEQAIFHFYKQKGAQVIGNGTFQVSTAKIGHEISTNQYSKNLYMNPGNGTVKIDLSPYFGINSANIGINLIQLLNIKPDPQDIQNGKVMLEPLYRDVTLLFQMAKSAINGQLFKKIIKYDYNQIQFHLQGSINNKSIIIFANF